MTSCDFGANMSYCPSFPKLYQKGVYSKMKHFVEVNDLYHFLCCYWHPCILLLSVSMIWLGSCTCRICTEPVPCPLSTFSMLILVLPSPCNIDLFSLYNIALLKLDSPPSPCNIALLSLDCSAKPSLFTFSLQYCSAKPRLFAFSLQYCSANSRLFAFSLQYCSAKLSLFAFSL